MPSKCPSHPCTTEEECPNIFKGTLVQQDALCLNQAEYSPCTPVFCFLIYLWLSSMTINSGTYSFISWRLPAQHCNWPWLCPLILSWIQLDSVSLEVTSHIILVLFLLHPALRLQYYRHSQHALLGKKGFNSIDFNSGDFSTPALVTIRNR